MAAPPVPRPRRRVPPFAEPRQARKSGTALEVQAVFQLLKYVKLFSFHEEPSSKYISIFPDVFKYTGLEPRRREYEPACPSHVNPPPPPPPLSKRNYFPTDMLRRISRIIDFPSVSGEKNLLRLENVRLP